MEKAVKGDIIRKYYAKEFLNSLEIAKKYRQKINPTDKGLPESSEMKEIIIKKVNNELKIRISKGYKNIDLNLVEDITNNILFKLNIIK
ncbi:hypothetical protein HYX02_01395 [Candidatus Woesearchaeota archaeon]|nr:hypothetical protein [Candidatus Woesearchaeota archaeon]